VLSTSTIAVQEGQPPARTTAAELPPLSRYSHFFSFFALKSPKRQPSRDIRSRDVDVPAPRNGVLMAGMHTLVIVKAQPVGE
jgi:hypothetical protein